MERKEMIKKLGEHFDVEPKYLKAPSFAYEIATGDRVYTIAKDGQVTKPLLKNWKAILLSGH